MDCFRVSVAAIVLIAGVICFPTAKSQEAQPDLCYAYVQNGELRVSCQGKNETIHVGEKLSQIAISPDGLYAAFESDIIGGKAKLTVVDLQTQTLKYSKTVNPTLLMATCGQLVGVGAIENERRNLLTWEKEELP